MYLLKPPVVVPPVPRRPHILYFLVVHETSMGYILVQHDKIGKKGTNHLLFGQKLADYESQYSSLEESYCALVWATQRLSYYMLHHIRLLISQVDALKYLFEKPALSGRLALWHLLLAEFDITYMSPRNPLKCKLSWVI